MLPSPRNRNALTLLEILLVCTLLSILALLVAPVSSFLRKQGHNTQCLTRLRQSGMILTTAIAEQGGSVSFWYSGAGSGEFWNTWLTGRGYLTPADLKKLHCPSIPYPEQISGRHYGIYMPDTTQNLINTYTPEGALQGRAYRINLKTIETPASTIFMGDSITSSGDLSIRIFRSDSSTFPSGAFHQRHQKHVNLYFFDGHAESAKPDRLYALGVRRVYDAELQAVTLTP